jgi:hypothetical protein
MRDRKLLRDKKASSFVNGLLPSYFENQSQELLASSRYGGIDSASGLAFVILISSSSVGGELRRRLFAYGRQDVVSLSEELLPSDEAPVVEFTHPQGASFVQQQQQQQNLACNVQFVALVPAITGINHHVHSYKKGASAYSGMSLYWSSPDGCVCFWRDISESNKDCDAFTVLSLDNDEMVTFVSYCASITMGSGSVLVGTSKKRIFHVWKNTRPLELHSRLLMSDELKDMTAASESESRHGLLSGIYSKLFTPGKPKGNTRGGVEEGVHRTQQGGPDGKTNGIIGIFNFTVSAKVFSPVKRPKHVHPNRDGAHGYIYTVANDGNLDVWSLSFDTYKGEYSASHVQSVSCLSKLVLNSSDKLMGATALHADIDVTSESACISLLIKASVLHEEMHVITDRYYIVHLPINVDTGCIDADLGSSVWLSRYSHEAINFTLNPIICAGLVTTIEEIDNEASTVVYSVFQPKKAVGHEPVTVSAIKFVESGSNHSIVDIDMPIDVVPRIICGAVQHDCATDGCNLIGTTGCVVNVKAIFPPVPTKDLNQGLASSSSTMVNPEIVEVVSSHLYSAFQTHERRLDAQYEQPLSSRVNEKNLSPFSKRLDPLLPPSITNADREVLSLAVIAVSAKLVDEASQGKDVMSALDIISDKVQMHQNFILYLIHAGIYKRVNFQGKLTLRDHGEMMYAIGGLLNSWNVILEAHARKLSLHEALDVDTDINYENELSLISKALQGMEERVTRFPENVLSFQRQVLPFSRQETFTAWKLFIILKIHCEALQNAMIYRSEQSEKLYDVSAQEYRSLFHQEMASSWFSSETSLISMHHSLKCLSMAAYQDGVTTHKLKQMRDVMGDIVEHLAAYILDGYSDINPTIRNEEGYDAAKVLSFDLLRLFCSCEAAFQMSLDHTYFSGIVQICDDNKKCGQYIPEYDLESLVSDQTQQCSSLHNSVDFMTGLNFSKFVFRWYTDKSMFGTALELGKLCPNQMSEYVEEDERLSHLRWIQKVNDGHFVQSASDLMSLKPDGIVAFGHSEKHISLEDQQLVLSLAKLAAMASEETSIKAKYILSTVQDNLILHSVQQTLAGMIDTYDLCERALDANSLMEVSLDLAKSVSSKDDQIKACLAGLSVAKVIHASDSIDQNDRHLQSAKVWAVSIDSDLHLWHDIVRTWSFLPDKDKIANLEKTTFFNVAYHYYSNPDVRTRDEVGFHPAQNDVLRLLGITRDDNLSNLLQEAVRFCTVSAS